MSRGYTKIEPTGFTHLRRPPVYRLTVVQLLVTAVLPIALLPIFGITVAISALAGGLCCAIPNAYFIRHAFKYSGARSARLIANSFYKGEAGKLLLTAAGFIIVFILVKPLNPAALLVAFILVQAMNWFTPLLVKSR